MLNLFPIETERLIIKPFQNSDFQNFLELHQNPDVMKYFISGIKSYERAKEVFNEVLWHQDFYGFSYWAIFLKQENKESVFIGQGGVVKNTPHYNLCFAFQKDYWGKGFGYESIQAIIDWFIQYTHLQKLNAITMPDNTPSKNLLLKAGFKYIKDKKLKKSKIVASHFEVNLKKLFK